MSKIHRTALMMFSAEQMYELVNDIASYPEYMEGCKAAQIISRDTSEIVAKLTLAKGGVSTSFTTRNQLVPYRTITLNLLDGPFSHFEGSWHFLPLEAKACKVELKLQFALDGGLLQAATAKLLDSVSLNLVDSVCRRAREVYV